MAYGQVHPQTDKSTVIAVCLRPKTKQELRQFLGLAGYYGMFVPNYEDIASLLTNLTNKGVADLVQ